MAKYYVIPVSLTGQGYFGVRALLNPYTGAANWCAGTPNVFGGNDDGRTVRETIYHEAREESHFKIDINTQNLVFGGAGSNFQQVHQSGTMTFYAIRGQFTHNLTPYFPAILANQRKYQECTGQVIRVDMAQVNTAHKSSSGGDVLRAFQLQFGPTVISSKASTEFLGSEMTEAIRQTAMAVRAGTL